MVGCDNTEVSHYFNVVLTSKHVNDHYLLLRNIICSS